MTKLLKYVGIPVLVVAILGGYLFFSRDKKLQYEFVTAKKRSSFVF